MDADLAKAGTLLTLCAIWWLFHFAYRQHCIDRTRQRLFAIRDNLFFESADRRVLDHPAYKLTRQTLNGWIRFAHEVSLLEAIALVIAMRRASTRTRVDDFSTKRRKALDGLSPQDRELFAETFTNAHAVLAAHIIQTSLVLAFVQLVVKHVARRQLGIAKANGVERQMRIIDAAAYDEGLAAA